ncbi:MAG: glycosyltransferase, partial [Planctomycetota bacterium]
MTRPPRSLHVVESLDRYAVAARLRRLAPRLAESGWPLEIAALHAFGSSASSFTAEGVSTRTLRRRWTIDPLACARLSALLKQGRYRLVHAWGAAAIAHVALARTFKDRTPWTISVDRADSRNRMFGLLLRVIGRRIESGLVPDESVSHWCRDHGVSAGRITVGPIGATPAPRVSIDRGEFLARLKLAPDARVIA